MSWSIFWLKTQISKTSKPKNYILYITRLTNPLNLFSYIDFQFFICFIVHYAFLDIGCCCDCGMSSGDSFWWLTLRREQIQPYYERKNKTFVVWENSRTFDAVHVFCMTPLKCQCRCIISINSLFGRWQTDIFIEV